VIVAAGREEYTATRGSTWRADVRRAGESLGEPLDRGRADALFSGAPVRGHDLSRVRIHTDLAAEHAAERIGARAFTIGSHIFFGREEYRPGEAAGRRLLRHELAHVLQSPSTTVADVDRLPLSDPGDSAEHEAGAAAEHDRPAVPSTRLPSVRRVLAAYASPHTDVLPAMSAGGAPSFWVPTMRSSADAAGLQTALTRLIAVGKVDVTTDGNRRYFSVPATGGATLAEVATALTGAGYPRAHVMAAALVNRHNAWLFAGEEVHELSSFTTLEVGRQHDVLRQTDRPLTSEERAEARLVFGPGLDYGGVRVTEDPVLGSLSTARTLPSTIYFPPGSSTRSDYLPWLIHELTHTWQYQHGVGIARTAGNALLCVVRLKTYDYGGEPGLVAAAARGERFADFNTEQQGDITSDYYLALKAGRSTTAWAPFLPEIQAPP
jgi:hypothetical protein